MSVLSDLLRRFDEALEWSQDPFLPDEPVESWAPDLTDLPDRGLSSAA